MNYVAALHVEIWALSVVFLFFKMMANSAVQGFARSRDQKLAVAEDSAVFAAFQKGTPQKSSDLLERASACWRNDLENIPLFLFLTLAYLTVGANTFLLLSCSVIFCFARSFHTFAYIRKLQPYRTLSYLLGNIATVVVAIAILARIFIVGPESPL